MSLHLAGMAGLSITPLPTGAIVDDTARGLIAFAVTGIALLILATGAVTYVLDDLGQIDSAARLSYLARSAVDGMVVSRGGRIIEANGEFERSMGRPREALIGRPIAAFLGAHAGLPDGR